jgi:hypothetical protein
MAFPERHAAAMIGDPGAIARKVPMVATLRPRREELRKCRGPGILIGFEDMRPASLRKATTEPVKVTPPKRMSKASRRTERELTNQDAQVSGYHMQGGDICSPNMCHHTTETGQDGC